MRMVTAYSMLDNGGRRVIPTLIDRIQDRYGHTIYKHDHARMHRLRRRQLGQPAGADAGRPARAGDRPDDRLSDHLDDGRRRAARHRRPCVRDVGKPIAGKTGTTNEEKDVWFIGFSPDIVCGVYMGYDKPRHIGAACDRRPSGGAGRARFPESGACRQAADPVPRAARHQADPRQRQNRHARRGRATPT